MTAKNAHTTNQNSATHKKSLLNMLQDYDEQFKDFLKEDLANFASVTTKHGILKPELEISLDEKPLYPKDPTALSDTDLGKKYAEFVAWLSYCSYKLANAESEVIYYTSVEDKSRKLLYNYYIESSPEIGEKMVKQLIERNIEIIFINDCLTMAKAKKKIIEGLYNHYDLCMKGLSREISRRKGDGNFFDAGSLKN